VPGGKQSSTADDPVIIIIATQPPPLSVNDRGWDVGRHCAGGCSVTSVTGWGGEAWPPFVTPPDHMVLLYTRARPIALAGSPSVCATPVPFACASAAGL
jgi:hypothetical protein